MSDEERYQEQLRELATWPHLSELHQSDQGSSVPYLTGDMVKLKLNRIFGPQNWGYEVIAWPRLDQVGNATYYYGEYEVWFRFVNGDMVKRQVPGVLPLQGGADAAKMPIVRMGIVGCLTDAIKEAAGMLGSALGLGLADTTVERAVLGSRVDREGKTPQQHGEDLYGSDSPASAGKDQAKASAPSGKGNGQPAQSKANGANPGSPAPGGRLPRLGVGGQADGDARTRGKTARVMTGDWAKAAEQIVAATGDFYRTKDGQINFYRLTGAAAKCGYPEITNENLADVSGALIDYAQANGGDMQPVAKDDETPF